MKPIKTIILDGSNLMSKAACAAMDSVSSLRGLLSATLALLFMLALSGAAHAQTASFDPTSITNSATGAVSTAITSQQTVLNSVIAILVGFLIFSVVRRSLSKGGR